MNTINLITPWFPQRTYPRSLNILLMILLCAHIPSWGQQMAKDGKEIAKLKEQVVTLEAFSVSDRSIKNSARRVHS